MKNTKIDWCDSTLNPVVGCKNNCPYCYARKLNDRFGFIEKWNEPQFFPGRLEQLKSKKGKSIFMNSMSDIMYWEKEWFQQFYKAIIDNPQHNYILLTKSTSFFITNKPKNVYLGATIDNQSKTDVTWIHMYDFLSIEPLLEPITFKERLLNNTCLKQVIIGAETGNRKDKVVPKKEWINNIVKQCDKYKIRVFMKESLRDIMGNDFRQDPLIWEIKNDNSL